MLGETLAGSVKVPNGMQQNKLKKQKHGGSYYLYKYNKHNKVILILKSRNSRKRTFCVKLFKKQMIICPLKVQYAIMWGRGQVFKVPVLPCFWVLKQLKSPGPRDFKDLKYLFFL